MREIKKIKNINLKEVLVFLLISVYTGATILIRPLNNLDEIWNFNFAKCISKGLIPYRDFNMVQTPLLPIINGSILKIFGPELFVTRILSIFLGFSIIFFLYKIMQKLDIVESFRYITIIISIYLMSSYLSMDYNWVTILVLLIIIYLEIGDKDKNKENTNLIVNFKKDVLIGILSGICIMLKQNTGLFISIIALGYNIFEIRDKKQIKDFFYIVLVRGIGVLIPIFIIGLYLIINGAFNDFFDYCILGLGTFSNKISYIQRLVKNDSIIFRILSIMPIIYIVTFIMYFRTREKNLLIISLYGLAELFIIYPIADEAHFIIAVLIIFINITYFFNYIYKIIIKNKGYFEKFNYIFTNIIISIAIVVIGIYTINFIKIFNNSNINKELFGYKLIPMSQSQIDEIKQVDEYILKSNKKVYILDAQAAIYMIPIDRYNKNYDMFLKGNIGSKDEEGQIENLKKDREITVLILNSKYNRNWQNLEEVRRFVLNNMKKIGEIGIFDIYNYKN